MSDLYDAVDGEIRAYTPGVAPPFALLTDRKRRRDRRRVGLGAGAVVLVMIASGAAWESGAFERDSAGGLAGDGTSATPEPGLVTTETPVSGATYVLLDNRNLQVQVAVGGGCQETGTASARVSDDGAKVKIAMLVTRHDPTSPPPAVCTAQLILQKFDIRLSRDIGTRLVVDEVGGKTLLPAPPDGARTLATGIKAPPAVQLLRTDEFGIVTAMTGDAAHLQISVDRVDMLTGSEAVAAARAAGASGPAEYYLRNDSTQTRTYRIDRGANVWGSIQLLPNSEPWPQRTTLEHWRQFMATHLGQRPLFHFTVVENDIIIGIEEQYLP